MMKCHLGARWLFLSIAAVLLNSCAATSSKRYIRAEQDSLPTNARITEAVTSAGDWISFSKPGGRLLSVVSDSEAKEFRAIVGTSVDGNPIRVLYDSVVFLKAETTSFDWGTASFVLALTAAVVSLIIGSYTFHGPFFGR